MTKGNPLSISLSVWSGNLQKCKWIVFPYCVLVQGEVKLENFAIPEPLFTAPIEDLFELLGKTLAEFVNRVRGWALTVFVKSTVLILWLPIFPFKKKEKSCEQTNMIIEPWQDSPMTDHFLESHTTWNWYTDTLGHYLDDQQWTVYCWDLSMTQRLCHRKASLKLYTGHNVKSQQDFSSWVLALTQFLEMQSLFFQHNLEYTAFDEHNAVQEQRWWGRSSCWLLF